LSTLKRNNLTVINKTDKDIDRTMFDNVLEIISAGEGIESKTMNLVLTNDETIREFNRKYLGKDALTDVISFPSEIDFMPFLGDIIIDIEVADGQKGKQSLQSELQFLFMHGLLHLLGYDHLSSDTEKVMKKKEKEYFSRMKEKL